MHAHTQTHLHVKLPGSMPSCCRVSLKQSPCSKTGKTLQLQLKDPSNNAINVAARGHTSADAAKRSRQRGSSVDGADRRTLEHTYVCICACVFPFAGTHVDIYAYHAALCVHTLLEQKVCARWGWTQVGTRGQETLV